MLKLTEYSATTSRQPDTKGLHTIETFAHLFSFADYRLCVKSHDDGSQTLDVHKRAINSAFDSYRAALLRTDSLQSRTS